jgi:hypothetical protein
MSASHTIEFEQGTDVCTDRRHNGYYAGDFSDRPLPSDLSRTPLLASGSPRFEPSTPEWWTRALAPGGAQ